MQKFEQHQLIEKFEQNVDSVFRKELVRLIKSYLGVCDFRHQMKRPVKDKEVLSKYWERFYCGKVYRYWGRTYWQLRKYI